MPLRIRSTAPRSASASSREAATTAVAVPLISRISGTPLGARHTVRRATSPIAAGTGLISRTVVALVGQGNTVQRGGRLGGTRGSKRPHRRRLGWTEGSHDRGALLGTAAGLDLPLTGDLTVEARRAEPRGRRTRAEGDRGRPSGRGRAPLTTPPGARGPSGRRAADGIRSPDAPVQDRRPGWGGPEAPRVPREGATGGVERSRQRCGIAHVGRAGRVGEQQSQAGDPGRVQRAATPQQRCQAHEAVAVGRHRSRRAGHHRPPRHRAGGREPVDSGGELVAAAHRGQTCRSQRERARAGRVPAGDEGSVERVGAEGGDQAGPHRRRPRPVPERVFAVLGFDAFVTPPFRYSWCR